eukprot:6449223-Pyramimonas_sp.AAC.1
MMGLSTAAASRQLKRRARASSPYRLGAGGPAVDSAGSGEGVVRGASQQLRIPTVEAKGPR